MTSRESVLTYLRSLTDKELLETVYDALRGRSTGDVPEARDHYVLGHVSLEGERSERWELEVVARDDPAHYPAGYASDVAICQSGQCDGCGWPLRSWAKKIICPVCGGAESAS